MKVEVNLCKRIFRRKYGKHRKPLSTPINYQSTPETPENPQHPRKHPQSNMANTYKLLITTVETVQIMQLEDSFDYGKR